MPRRPARSSRECPGPRSGSPGRPAMMKLDVFERAVQKAQGWLKDLQAELGWGDRHQTYEALGIVLQVLRNRLPVQEAVNLGAQLPLLLRGLYFQSWDVSKNPEKYRHADEFLM